MTDQTSYYRAVQATAPGRLELVRKPVIDPPAGYVRLRVEACGVCHSDAATIEGVFPINWPRVPGHEAVGVIEALGQGIDGWKAGQRVGVGFLGGCCGHCRFCRDGALVHCENQEFTGIHVDGGYAEIMMARASGLVAIPDDLASVDAAPLLCAGLTTFGALRDSGVKAGELVAVLGIGGLGHLALQYARAMGLEVAAIGRGSEKADLAHKLGAHHYIDGAAEDAAQALRALGGAALVIATASSGGAAADLVKGLHPGGKLLVLGASPEPIAVSTADLLFGGRAVAGSLTGTPATGDATLRFSNLTGIAAMIETVPLARAAEAYARMIEGKARFRVVLTMDGGSMGQKAENAA